MWWPRLDQNLYQKHQISSRPTPPETPDRKIKTDITHHIARQKTPCIASRPPIWPAPENNHPPLVLAISKNIVQRHGKPIQVPDVEWAEIVVESVVQQSVVNSEVDWLHPGRVYNAVLATLVGGPGNVGWDMLRGGLVGVRDGGRRERRSGCWRGSVGSQVKAVYSELARERMRGLGAAIGADLRCTQ